MAVYLFQSVNLNVLRCHEEDGGQCASIHLGYRYREDKQPGEHTGQGVDHGQDRVTQQKPDISTYATLQSRIETMENH